jgi:hypothetical protein
MNDFEALARAIGLQARACDAMGSPFSGALLERAAEALDADGAFRAAFAPWAGKSVEAIFEDAAPIRWLGAMHDAALASPTSELAATYPAPGRDGDPEAAWPLVSRLMAERGDEVAAFMRHEPQTNEVRRSAVLLPGFLAAAEATGLPMRILELGASAGLNQLWDRYGYRLGADLAWGPADASVQLDADWRGGAPPLSARVDVAQRAACDRRPLDLTDPRERRRLKAYIWAGQFDRLARFDAAAGEALAAGVTVETADAVDWAAANAAPRPGLATVVFHSVFFQYMPPASQAALVETLSRHGAAATREAPLVWLRMEPAGKATPIMDLRLTLWPGGEERLLAHAHPHGAWIEWLS